jgi:hypothetical protein
MNFTQSTFRSLLAAMLLATVAAFGLNATCEAQAAPPAQSAGAAQAAAPAPPPSFCGNQPLCYEASDFAATVTDFRTSVQGGYKIIDTVIRFQNKTPNPVILGYVVNSGTAMDDRGNRYIIYGANGYRGIGQVYGNNFDPRFTLSPGGYGDAQFELMWAPGQQIYGSTFDLSMSVDEINTVEGNQHTLGGEFPLLFKSLSNGVSSNGASGGGAAGVPMTAMTPSGGAASGGGASVQTASAAGQPQPGCAANGIAGTATSVAGATGSAAAQNAAGAANTKVASAANAISSLGSIFGRKKKPAAAAPNAAPCPQAAPAVAAPASSAASTASAAAQTMRNGTAPAAASPASVTNVSASTTIAPAQAPAAAKQPAPATKKPAATPKKSATPTTPTKPSQE